MRLAGPFAAEHRNDFGMRRRSVSIQIDNAQQLFTLAEEQVRHMVKGAHFIIGIASEVIAEGIAGAAQQLQGALRQTTNGGGGGHGIPPRPLSDASQKRSERR